MEQANSSFRNEALGVGGFLVGTFGPTLIAPELQYVGFGLGLCCLVYGFWPRIVRLHRIFARHLEPVLLWFVWPALVLVLAALVTLGNSLIEAQRYHLNYEVCFGSIAVKTPLGPKVSDVKVWTRIMNRNEFPVAVEVVEASLRLGKGASVGAMPRGQQMIIPGALTAITDSVQYDPPITPEIQTGEMRYVLRLGKRGEKLDRTMVIKGQIVHQISADGKLAGASFTLDPDSDPNYSQKECIVEPDNRIRYRGK